MSSLPGCMSLAAAPAAADSAEIAELQQAVVEELGISMEELRQYIDEELEKMDCIQQRKKQLAELETWVLQKESEVAYVDRLFDDASRISTLSWDYSIMTVALRMKLPGPQRSLRFLMKMMMSSVLIQVMLGAELQKTRSFVKLWLP